MSNTPRNDGAVMVAALLTFLISFGVLMFSQEKVVVTTPIVRTTTDFQVIGMSFTRLPTWTLVITYQDNVGNTFSDLHTTPSRVENLVDAQTLIVQLNKANLTTKSLERRLMEHLQQEGKIPAGTITGTPQ